MEMQFESIMPVTEMTREAPETLSDRDGRPPSDKQEASPIPTPPTGAVGGPRERGAGEVLTLRWGRDAGGRRGRGWSLGGGKTESWVQRVQQITQRLWLLAWRCETTHRARPGGERLPLVTVPAEAISRRNNAQACGRPGPETKQSPQRPAPARPGFC